MDAALAEIGHGDHGLVRSAGRRVLRSSQWWFLKAKSDGPTCPLDNVPFSKPVGKIPLPQVELLIAGLNLVLGK